MAFTIKWMDAHVDVLKRNWGVKSASEISTILFKEFGIDFSKNAVIGKAHRIGLSNTMDNRKGVSAEPLKPHDKSEVPLPLEKLGPKQCRWMFAVDKACGKPVCGNKPFCEAHCQQAYLNWNEKYIKKFKKDEK